MKHLLTIFTFCTIMFSCKQKPAPIPAQSDILKYTIIVPTNKAVDIISKLTYEPATSTLSDFAYINLGISAPFKNLQSENNCQISTLIWSDAIFNTITNKAMLIDAVANGSPNNTQQLIEINEPLAPYNIRHKYFSIITNNGKVAIMRIDGYQAGVAHDLQLSIILVK